MEKDGRIITVGLSPAWDISCLGRDLDWGQHAIIDEQVVRPAGKAMNVSCALAWMGVDSVAAGLWGRDDYDEMQAATARLDERIATRLTAVEGRTRRNITVVDTLRHREMHLRDPSSLASADSLGKLGAALSDLIRPGDVCVFAGAMPGGGLLAPTLDLVRTCRKAGARIAVDTYGPVLQGIVDESLAWLIAPNVAELNELLDAQIEDTPAKLVAGGRTLLDRLDMALISRGAKGAILVTKEAVWTGAATTRRPALSTVGCGDYLLAGFLAGLQETGNPREALANGLKAATARAWGWTDSKAWLQVDKEMAVAVEPL